ncbi:S8 family serine peptidase [Cellulomonas sp. URHD0024]|uniref:S8 family serine peptidase n=1 Tax=Cellulomonas sp. URHD0024 TaxID=1302620 RepID=UPI00040DF324|nr:S8 family serine peptidase [Cellulomonas sp. URHD0024]
MPSITINGITIDTAEHAPHLQALAMDAASVASSDHILIHTTAPLTADQRDEIAATGAEVHEYVSADTYLATYRPADIAPVEALPFVDWAGPYSKAFKIPPSLLDRSVDPSSVRDLADATPHPARQFESVDLLLHPGITASDQLVERVAAVAGVNSDQVVATASKLRVTTEAGNLPSLASIDEVREIHPVPERRLFNNVARGILNAEVVVNGTAYRGRDELIAVADTGFDTGDPANPHPAFTGRVDALLALGRTGPDQTDDPHGHGTHVSGSVLGQGSSPTMGGSIEGTAPEAHLVLQSLLDSGGGLGGIPVDLNDLFRTPYDSGARVHTNSWGETTPGLPYSAASREIDEFVWNHPDQVICFAAGNDGIDRDGDGVVDPGQIGSESAAKNCITVGASESHRPHFEPTWGRYWPDKFPVDPVNSDQQADDVDGMAAFSSRGPTREQRIKPDVVAPGTSILSTRSRKAGDDSAFGTSADPLYFFDSGTSMATPLVAGCAAVLRESLVRNGTPTPSAALIKALLINGAEALPGQYSPTEAGASPNVSSGWGRVNLAGSVILPGNPVDSGFGEGGPLDQGQEDTFTVDIPPGRGEQDAGTAGVGATFKVSLVWSDPAGALLQNDLDLIVVAADGTERHGNAGTTDDFDRLNNVEQVLWTDIPPGPCTVVVRAFRITQLPQPYAYVWKVS